MTAAAHPTVAVVGREAEREHLATLFARAAAGEPSFCVVHGEAGIGKTTVVRDACRAWPGAVLWGTCVHFGAATVPFAAVASAVDGWLTAAEEEVRSQSPLGRIAVPSDVAAAVAWLSSARAEWCSGAVLDVNGASHLR